MTAPAPACGCPRHPGYTIHQPDCPEYARLGIRPISPAQWFHVRTVGGDQDEDHHGGEDEHDPGGRMAAWESARVYGGGDVD